MALASFAIWLAAFHGVRAQELLGIHQHTGITCGACHAEAPPQKAPPSSKCTSCHGDQAAVANRTANKTPNPHAPPHLAPGETQDCEECHHVHKPSEVTCMDCHHGFNFNIK
jgi:hypothetical protein